MGVFVKKKISESQFSSNEINEFVDNCIAFYIELCLQITKRFDFNDICLKEFYCLEPLQIINKKVTSLSGLIDKFPNLINESEIQNLNDEFRELRYIDFKNYFSVVENINCEEFWGTISKFVVQIINWLSPPYLSLCRI